MLQEHNWNIRRCVACEETLNEDVTFFCDESCEENFFRGLIEIPHHIHIAAILQSVELN